MSFPDVVEALAGYLAPIVAPTPVTSRVPPDPQPRPPFVQIRRVGGGAVQPVRDQARIDVFCWNNDEPAAMATALQVRQAIWALSGSDLLGFVVYDIGEFMGPRQFDDTLSGIPRIWATYSITVRADDVIQPSPAVFDGS